MEKIKTLLVDDERDSREVLSSLIEKYFTEIEIIGEASNVPEAYELIINRKPQLVFLDIQMPKEGGFDLLKKFREIPFEIVFVTSFDKYAINAIKFSALDYLLKPVEVKDLDAAITKAVKSIGLKTNKGSQVINLLQNLDNEATEKRIAVHVSEKVKFLNQADIVDVEGDGRYCRLTMLNGESYSTAKNLKDFEEYFEATRSFVRISKDVIINIRHIKSYSKGEPCIIEMVNGKTYDVARRKKTKVLEKLRQ